MSRRAPRPRRPGPERAGPSCVPPYGAARASRRWPECLAVRRGTAWGAAARRGSGAAAGAGAWQAGRHGTHHRDQRLRRPRRSCWTSSGPATRWSSSPRADGAPAGLAGHRRRRRARAGIVISTYPERAKIANVRRDPQVSVLVLSDDFGGAWVQVDGTCEVLDLPEAARAARRLLPRISGEHPDWDEYRAGDARPGQEPAADHADAVGAGGHRRLPRPASRDGPEAVLRVGLTGGIGSGKSDGVGPPGRARRGGHRRRPARPGGGRPARPASPRWPALRRRRCSRPTARWTGPRSARVVFADPRPRAELERDRPPAGRGARTASSSLRQPPTRSSCTTCRCWSRSTSGPPTTWSSWSTPTRRPGCPAWCRARGLAAADARARMAAQAAASSASPPPTCGWTTGAPRRSTSPGSTRCGATGWCRSTTTSCTGAAPAAGGADPGPVRRVVAGAGANG